MLLNLLNLVFRDHMPIIGFNNAIRRLSFSKIRTLQIVLIDIKNLREEIFGPEIIAIIRICCNNPDCNKADMTVYDLMTRQHL